MKSKKTIEKKKKKEKKMEKIEVINLDLAKLKPDILIG